MKMQEYYAHLIEWLLKDLDNAVTTPVHPTLAERDALEYAVKLLKETA